MTKTFLDYLNLFLIGILLFILAMFAYFWITNKEFDKQYFSAEIKSSAGNSIALKTNTIQIIEAEFRNSFNHSSQKIHSDSKLISSSISTDSIYFRSQTELLPDFLHLKYFSIDERQFYNVNAKLPSFIIKKTIKNKNTRPKFVVEVHPKGIITIKIVQKNLPSKMIIRFQAEKATGKLDELVYETSLGKKYNRFESIKSINDYSDLLQSQYFWGFVTILQDKTIMGNAYSYSYDLESEYDFEDLKKVKKRNIPQTFYLEWRDAKKHSTQFTFDPNEILQAFRTLNKTEGNDPIIITFRLLKDQEPECVISKGSKIISLTDLYPN